MGKPSVFDQPSRTERTFGGNLIQNRRYSERLTRKIGDHLSVLRQNKVLAKKKTQLPRY